jgi:hypothetical protein
MAIRLTVGGQWGGQNGWIDNRLGRLPDKALEWRS